jgi:hypothetical protein
MFYKKPRPSKKELRRFTSQAESYLRGSYLEIGAERAEAVPTWCWVNALAHGTLADLEQICRGSAEEIGLGPELSWRAARRQLCSELFALAAGSEQALRHVQLEVLVPFESRLMKNEGAVLKTPSELISRIRALLASSSS